MRAFAQLKLVSAESDAALRDRHLAHYLALGEKAAPELTGPHQAEWLARLETEHENLRAALAHTLDSPPVIARNEVTKQSPPAPSVNESPAPESRPPATVLQGVRLAVALGRFWLVHGWFSESREFFSLAIRKNPNPTSNEQGHSLRWAGSVAAMQGDYSEARRLLSEGLAIFQAAGDRIGEAATLNVLGNVAWNQRDYAVAKGRLQESIVISRELGDKRGIANVLGNLGNVAYDEEDYENASQFHREALAINRELGNRGGIASALNNLGNVAHDQGKYQDAKRLRFEALALYRELGDQRGIADSLSNLGLLAHAQGDFSEARRLHQQSLAIKRELGDKRGIANSLEGLGHAAAREGKALWAARLFGAGDALREALLSPRATSDHAEYAKAVSGVKAALGEDAFTRSWAEGRAMSLDQAIAYALDEGRDLGPGTREYD